MEYLHSMDFIHGCLSARNVLLHEFGKSGQIHAQISDYGMTRVTAGNGVNYFNVISLIMTLFSVWRVLYNIFFNTRSTWLANQCQFDGWRRNAFQWIKTRERLPNLRMHGVLQLYCGKCWLVGILRTEVMAQFPIWYGFILILLKNVTQYELKFDLKWFSNGFED